MKASAHDISRALIELAAQHPDGEKFLRQIRDELSRKLRDEAGAASVTLTTPSGDAGHLADAISKYLRGKLGRDVEVIQKADPSLLGGAILQYGDHQIDVSVRGALRDLERKLRSAPVSTQA